MASPLFHDHLRRHAEAVEALGANSCYGLFVDDVSALMVASLRAGGKICFFGNGGSAADAQHLATEFVVRYRRGDAYENRPALAALAMTVDSSALTAGSNDFHFDRVFERQVDALVKPEDVVVGISTSGNSESVLRGIAKAKDIGARTVGFTGGSGGKLIGLAEHVFCAPTADTDVIQECHILVGHVLCDIVEEAFYPG